MTGSYLLILLVTIFACFEKNNGASLLSKLVDVYNEESTGKKDVDKRGYAEQPSSLLSKLVDAYNGKSSGEEDTDKREYAEQPSQLTAQDPKRQVADTNMMSVTRLSDKRALQGNVTEETKDILRNEAEGCDCLQGFEHSDNPDFPKDVPMDF